MKDRLARLIKSRGLYLLLFAVLIALAAVWGLSSISDQVDDNQLEFMENAIRRSAIQCYALEGRFPETVEYLEENYSLALDKKRFIIDYDYIAGNIIPQINVYVLGGK